MRIPRPPPALIKEKASAEWARAVSEIGARWSRWTPSFIVPGSPDVAMDDQVVDLSVSVPVGSLCFVSIDANFNIPVSKSPAAAVGFNLPLPIDAIAPNQQHVIIGITGTDNVGTVWREACQAYTQGTMLYLLPSQLMYRSASFPTYVRGNFFYIFTRYR